VQRVKNPGIKHKFYFDPSHYREVDIEIEISGHRVEG